MAKIVSYVMNGGVEPVLGTKVTPTYSDIGGHWAEAYIEYCTSMGIIAGDGAGKFNPEGTLTASQTAKMFLTAMGYDANVFGFVGTNWEVNTNRYANEAGLYKDLGDVNPTSPISRDDAAQMAYNAIQATMMRRTWSQNMETGQLTETYQPWTETVTPAGGTAYTVSHTLLGEKFNGAIAYAYMVDFDYDDVKNEWDYYFSDSAEFGGSAIDANKAFTSTSPLTSSEDYTDLFGQQVKIIYNVDDPDVIYGIYASDSSVVATGASGELGDIDDTARTIKVDGTTYRLGVASGSIGVFDTGVNANVDTLANLKTNQKASAFTFKLVDNTGDGRIDAVIRTPLIVSQIIYVGTSTISFNNLTQKDQDLVNIYEGYAQGDWVYYTAAANASTCEDTFVKAELQTSTVDAVKGSAEASGYSDYQLNGSWYAETTSTVPSRYSVADADVNDTVEYVTLGSVVFYAKITDVAATTKNVAMVITADTVSGEGDSNNLGDQVIKAKLITSDGNKSTVTVAKVNGATATFGSAPATDVDDRIGTLVTYRVNSDGEYELTDVSATNLAGYKGVGDNSAYSDEEIGGYELADDAVVFTFIGSAQVAAGTNDAKVYTGREVKNAYGSGTISTASALPQIDSVDAPAALWSNTSGFSYAQVAALNVSADLSITTGSNYGYLTTGASRTVENDKTYLNLTFWTSDGSVTAKFESMDAPSAYPAGAIITYDTVAEGEIKNVSIVNAATGTVTGWDGVSKIQISGLTSSAEVDSVDTVVFYVNSKDKTGAETAAIQLGKDSNNDGVADIPNVRYVASSNVLSLLVVDVNNEMEAGPAMTLSGAGVTSADVTAALSSSDSVTLDSDLTNALTATVEDGKTLTFTAAQTQTHSVTVKAGGTVVIPTGKLIGGTDAVFSATGEVTLKSADSGVQVSASAGTLTLNGDMTIDDNDKLTLTGDATLVAAPGTELVIGDSKVESAVHNFYTSTSGSAPADGTYTYYSANTIQKADGSVCTHAAGWYTADGVSAVQAA